MYVFWIVRDLSLPIAAIVYCLDKIQIILYLLIELFTSPIKMEIYVVKQNLYLRSIYE